MEFEQEMEQAFLKVEEETLKLTFEFILFAFYAILKP